MDLAIFYAVFAFSASYSWQFVEGKRKNVDNIPFLNERNCKENMRIESSRNKCGSRIQKSGAEYPEENYNPVNLKNRNYNKNYFILPAHFRKEEDIDVFDSNYCNIDNPCSPPTRDAEDLDKVLGLKRFRELLFKKDSEFRDHYAQFFRILGEAVGIKNDEEINLMKRILEKLAWDISTDLEGIFYSRNLLKLYEYQIRYLGDSGVVCDIASRLINVLQPFHLAEISDEILKILKIQWDSKIWYVLGATKIRDYATNWMKTYEVEKAAKLIPRMARTGGLTEIYSLYTQNKTENAKRIRNKMQVFFSTLRKHVRMDEEKGGHRGFIRNALYNYIHWAEANEDIITRAVCRPIELPYE